MIDVIIPFWDNPSWLGQSLFSIVTQELREPIKVHVINDAGRGNLVPIKFYFRNFNCIKWYHHKKRQGLHGVIRKGVRKATGEIVVIQSPNDIAIPTRLKQIALTIRNMQCDIVGSAMRLFGNSTGVMETVLPHIPLNTVGFRKQVFGKGSSPNIYVSEVPLIYKRVFQDQQKYWSGNDRFFTSY